MIFNPHATKPAQEVIFSRKIKNHSSSSGFQQCSQKHLGVTLVLKLTFEEHLGNLFKKVSRTRALSLVVSDLRSETKGYPVRAQLLPMRRGEPPVVIARLKSKRVEVVVRS